MTDLRHWHRFDDRPSQYIEPPDCCLQAAEQARERAVDAAVREERQRIITAAAEAMTTYAEAAASVLTGEESRDLVATVVEQCLTALRRAACICSTVEIRAFDGSRIGRPVRDPACAAHSPGPVRREDS